ncbi:hypothetical protein CPAST_c22530 [Clostridium pasteurianum DSM 525 = ATCC 6013]|uniref:Uncharacterized protein n=1 Tax=Clostridium pasteurianum DSM 525 = ATCC 6013 TaxID=1262449 RepID=A0A0H3J8P1_CLOPA|nr:hypothetical protein [Clostridium pasteurianum]AJA48323.1 hypothetical protein CPAST_c22530 [Clostridium pasteurianum DSM 525 = ATCC 6013]AJA52311.1 hypothetical protein CLPA_c22530 [Clostridium pasteurianum DSM 525 = ATCC 6013]KRU11679.1 hypothetical protein CP6013_00926 [Clostridium pasteurianum DSM 525 = ATCC 6013]UZW12540.1 hypothetical protein OSC52_11800 [Clostridium pasteurianum]
MNINLKITLESPKLMEALLALAEEISKLQSEIILRTKEGQVSKKEKSM